jgi:AraC-binding-like domain
MNMLNESYLVLDTSEVDEAKAFTSTMCEGKQTYVLDGSTAFHSRIHSAQWGRIRLSHIAAEGQLAIACASGPADYLFQFWLAGKAALVAQAREVNVTPGDLIIAPVGLSSVTQFGSAHRSLVVSCDRQALEGHLELLLNRPIDTAIEFQPELSFRSTPGVFLYRLTRFMIDELNQNEPLTECNPEATRQIEESFYSIVLESIPHSYSGQLRNVPINGARTWRWPLSLNQKIV